MKYFNILVFLIVLATPAIGQKIKSSITTKLPELQYDNKLQIFDLDDVLPNNIKKVGTLDLRGKGTKEYPGYKGNMIAAELEARKNGANGIKILSHVINGINHKMSLMLFYSDDINEKAFVKNDTLDTNLDYALLYVYRPNGVGPIVSYDLHLDDSKIGRVKNNTYQIIKLSDTGAHELWAKTEAKSSELIKLEKGKKYYLRCSVTMGAFVGHPYLELVDNETGEEEFLAVKANN